MWKRFVTIPVISTITNEPLPGRIRCVFWPSGRRPSLRLAHWCELWFHRPEKKDQFAPTDPISPMLASALEHCELLDRLGFTQYSFP